MEPCLWLELKVQSADVVICTAVYEFTLQTYLVMGREMKYKWNDLHVFPFKHKIAIANILNFQNIKLTDWQFYYIIKVTQLPK